MSDRKLTFQRAQDFLIERVSLGPAIKRVGTILHASLDATVGNIAAVRNAVNLRNRVESAFEATNRAFREHLADFSDENHQRTVEFFFAETNRMSPEDQVHLFLDGQQSSSVAFAAARQRTVPLQLQFALVEHGAMHADAMRALAENTRTHPSVLLPLVTHPSRDVRVAVAAHIGSRMKIDEQRLVAEKQAVFDAIVDNYEDTFASFIIPICRDQGQLQRMFDRTAMTPTNAHLFADNPYVSNDILLDVMESRAIALLPGGQEAKERIRTLVTNRVGDHAGPTL